MTNGTRFLSFFNAFLRLKHMVISKKLIISKKWKVKWNKLLCYSWNDRSISLVPKSMYAYLIRNIIQNKTCDKIKLRNMEKKN